MRKGRVRRDFSQVLQVEELDTNAADVGLLRKRYDRLVARTNKGQKQAWHRRQAAADNKRQFAADRVESEAAAPEGATVVRAETDQSDDSSASRQPVTHGVVSVELTRTELVALRETIELNPVFEGRTDVRDAIQKVLHLRQTKPPPLQVEQDTLAALTERVIAIDVPTAALRSKLKRALNRGAVD